MPIGGFLQGLGLAAGENILVGQQLQEQQVNTQLKQQQLQMSKLAVAQQQQQVKDRKELGEYLASEQQKDGNDVSDPMQTAKSYQKAESMALQHGDFESANMMADLAKGKLQEAKENAVLVQQKQQAAKETLATSAENYSANPTPEGAKELATNAVAAGVNPLDIPPPGTVAFKTWANNQQLASKTAAERADFVQKAAEQAANRQEKRAEHADNIAERDATRRQTAAFQNGMLELRRSEEADRRDRAPTTKDIGGSTYQYDPSQSIKGDRDTPDKAWVKLAGPKVTATQSANNNAIVASASEGVRGLRIIGAMDSNSTAGPFAGLHDGTILESLAKTGTNAATPSDMQIYHTATAGMGLEIARTMTLGGGRGANQATIDEFQHIVEGHPGDDKATLLFKYANAADIIRNRLSTLPDTSDPKVRAQREEIESTLAKIPSPEAVLGAVSNPKQREKLLNVQSTMSNVAGKLQDETQSGGAPLPGGGDPSGGGTQPPPLPADGGLPAGWSVKVH